MYLDHIEKSRGGVYTQDVYVWQVWFLNPWLCRKSWWTKKQKLSVCITVSYAVHIPHLTSNSSSPIISIETQSSSIISYQTYLVKITFINMWYIESCSLINKDFKKLFLTNGPVYEHRLSFHSAMHACSVFCSHTFVLLFPMFVLISTVLQPTWIFLHFTHSTHWHEPSNINITFHFYGLGSVLSSEG